MAKVDLAQLAELEGQGYLGQSKIYNQTLDAPAPTTWDKMKALVFRAIYQGYALGIDVANYWRVDWPTVKPYINFAVCKSSEGATYKDPSFADNVQQTYDLGISRGAYHFYRIDPYLDCPYPGSADIVDKYWPKPADDVQLQNLAASLKYKAVDFICIDIEATTELVSGKVISATWQSAASKVFVGRVRNWMNANGMAGKRLYVYTSNGFISTYAPDMSNWLQNYDQWVAQWAVYPANTVTLTWEQAKANYMPSDAAKPKPFGNGTATLWQYAADRLILPGIYTNGTNQPRTADLNVFMGNVSAYKAFMGITDTPTPPPPPPDPDPEPTPDLTALTERVAKLETANADLLNRVTNLETFRDHVKAA